ncbi:MAG: OTU family ubiquitin thioesterase [archaeon]|nr:OTU family ubiquitin thioesterase [archaeon]
MNPNEKILPDEISDYSSFNNTPEISEIKEEKQTSFEHLFADSQSTINIKETKFLGNSEMLLLNKSSGLKLENSNEIDGNTYLIPAEIESVNDSEIETLMKEYSENDLKELYDFIMIKIDKKQSERDNINLSKIGSLVHLVESIYNYNPLYKSSMIESKKKLEENIFKWRKIKGDGNCYYRSVIFRYLEIIISENKIELLKSLIIGVKNALDSEIMKPRLKVILKNLKTKLVIEILLLIYKSLKKGEIGISLNILEKCIQTSPHFDYGLILYLRYRLYLYIKKNEKKFYSKNFCVKVGNLLPSEYEVSEDNFLFNGFYEKYLLKLYQDAEKIIIYLSPFALGINLNIYLYDEKDKNPLKEFNCFNDVPENNRPEFIPTINLINRKAHYEIIYTKSEYDKHEKYFNKHLLSIPPKIFTDEVNKTDELNFQHNSDILSQDAINSFFDSPNIPKPIREKDKETEATSNKISYQDTFNSTKKKLILQDESKSISQSVAMPLTQLNLDEEKRKHCLVTVKCDKCKEKYKSCLDYEISLCKKCIFNTLIDGTMVDLFKNQITKIKKLITIDQQNPIDFFEHLDVIYDKQIKIHKGKSISLNEVFTYFSLSDNIPEEEIKKDFLSKVKIKYCLNCMGPINETDNTIQLPCKCIFCSAKCLTNYMDKDAITVLYKPNFYLCSCGQKYDFDAVISLYRILKMNQIGDHKEDIFQIIKKIFCKTCSKCGETVRDPKERIKVGFTVEGDPYELFQGSEFEYNHCLCPGCFEEISKERRQEYNCILCDIPHYKIAKVDTECIIY